MERRMVSIALCMRKKGIPKAKKEVESNKREGIKRLKEAGKDVDSGEVGTVPSS